MNLDRLIFRAYVEVPYMVDNVTREECMLDDEDEKLLPLYFQDDYVIDFIVPYHDSFGLPKEVVRNKVSQQELTPSEYDDVLAYFEDNNSCADDDYYIIKYDELEQSTAMYDSNKQLVFENDIIIDNDTNIEYIVNWKNGKYALVSEQSENYFDSIGSFTIVDNLINRRIKSSMEH